MSIFARMHALSEMSAIIQLMIRNGLSEVYMDKITPDNKQILKVTLLKNGISYIKDDIEYFSWEFDHHLDITIIYLELQKQEREFQLEQESKPIHYVLDIDFATIESSDNVVACKIHKNGIIEAI